MISRCDFHGERLPILVRINGAEAELRVRRQRIIFGGGEIMWTWATYHADPHGLLGEIAFDPAEHRREAAFLGGAWRAIESEEDDLEVSTIAMQTAAQADGWRPEPPFIADEDDLLPPLDLRGAR
jgi:hypothetical protein